MVIYVLLIVLGLSFGSFINALVWRLHEQRDFVSERSECVQCHHQLSAVDLIPVMSWAWLRGKCRYCHKPISIQYPLVELATAGVFIGSYVWWPQPLTALLGQIVFGLWCVMVVLLIALLVYDARWYLLPDKLTFPLIAVALLFSLLLWVGVRELTVINALIEMFLGVVSVAGLYYALYTYSKGAWVGFGDVKLGIAMGMILGWQLGLLSVFVANVTGLLFILPGMIAGKISAKSRIPFGPFLIFGLGVAFLFGAELIDWYVSTILSF